MMHPTKFFFSLLGLLFVLGGCNHTRNTHTSTDTGPIVATYGKSKVTYDELVTQLKKTSNPDTTSQKGFQDFLRRYVNFRLKVSEAERLGLDKDSTQVAELLAYQAQLGRPYLIENEVIRPLAKTLFERQKDVIKVQHILVRVGGRDTLAAYQKIKAVRDSLLNGADFATIATRNSDDPGVKNNKGILPPIVAGRFVEAFENLAWNTPIGKVSAISRSPEWGYHLLQVLERKPAPPAVRTSQLFVRPQGNTKADSLAAREKIQALVRRIKSGESFGAITRQYSDDPYLKENDGDIGFRETGELIEPLNTRIFELKNVGDLSEPLQTQFGYHVFMLTGRKETASFDDQYQQLKEFLSDKPILQRHQKAFASRLRKKMNVSFDLAAFQNMVHSVHQDTLFLGFMPATPFRMAHEKKVLATIDQNYVVRVSDFLDVAMRERLGPGYYPQEEALRIANEVIDDKAVDAYIRKMNTVDKRFDALLREYRDGILLFKISEDSLWNPASKDTLALKRFFSANQANYKFGERLRLHTFQTANDSLLNVIGTRLKLGIGAADIAASFKNDRSVRHEFMMLADSTNTIYDRGFGMKKGEYSEPLPYLRTKVILVSDGIEPPRHKTFDEARAEVTNEYQKLLEERWMNRLYNRYKVRFYPEKLDQALASRKQK
ncbi:MAG TPA: peptidylprolyl isomerase [Rhodothermales bacterium]|nr:peptidylprolyl isomerase [Rhodothermales bacterium]